MRGDNEKPEAFSVPACGVCGYPVQHCDDWTDRNGVCKCSGGRERASAPATSQSPSMLAFAFECAYCGEGLGDSEGPCRKSPDGDHWTRKPGEGGR